MTEIITETVIIGGGQAGVPLARALAASDHDVVLIEREHLGGSCVNFGCTPSKAVIASARLAADARRAAALGIHIRSVEVDFLAVMDRARDLVAQSKAELDASFADKANPHLLVGHGRLEGREAGRFRVRAGNMLVRARRVVLDTGTRTARPAIPGLDQVPVIDDQSWIALREPPSHLLILGGSYIGLEMAQALRRLGCAVTVLEIASQLAGREDPDVAEVLHDALERDGCRIHLNVDVHRVEAVGQGVCVHLASGTIEGSHLLLATGRQPNTDDLGLETLGIRLGDHGTVKVNDRLRTSVPGVWAAGDIRGGPAFTHTAYDDFRVLRSQFLGDGGDTTCRIVPYAIFTEPELGRVGMSEVEACNSGRPVRIGRHDMADSGKARELGRTEGFIKVVVDAETDRILGATALCEQGAEVVQLFVELMNAGATARMVQDAIHIHPTLAEAAKNAVLAACRPGHS
jgi:pyruvate/2-oxoglutarate dehydrogenase complex dihydrolipoamide dehydrogenase (E3) component